MRGELREKSESMVQRSAWRLTLSLGAGDDKSQQEGLESDGRLGELHC